MIDLLNERPVKLRSEESRAKQSRSMRITCAKKLGKRSVDIARELISEELGVENLSQRQLKDILIKRYLEGVK